MEAALLVALKRATRTTEKLQVSLGGMSQALMLAVSSAVFEARLSARRRANPRAPLTEEDYAAAQAAGMAYATAYTSAALAMRLLGRKPVPMAWRLKRIARSEVWQAWNAERRAAAEVAEQRGEVVEHIWNAELDGRACLECATLDGRTYASVDDVPEWPPLHPNCRCYVETVCNVLL